MYIIIVYDISLEGNGARVQRNIFRICKKYLNHIQLSVFEGEISKSNLEKLKLEIKKYIRKCDTLIIFKSRDPKWLEKEFLGNQKDLTVNFL